MYNIQCVGRNNIRALQYFQPEQQFLRILVKSFSKACVEWYHTADFPPQLASPKLRFVDPLR